MAKQNDNTQPINLVEAFEVEPPPLDLVLPGMLSGTVGALVSPGGVGKSMWALEAAIAVAGGPDLIGLDVTATGPVTYLPAEDPSLAIRHRLFAMGEWVSPNQRDALAERLMIWPLMGKRPDLFDPEWRDALTRMAEGRRLLILDTLRRFHTGEENDSGQMEQVLGHLEGICDRTECSILFLHHSSKALAVQGQGDMQQASRGSSVLVDNVRGGQYNLVGMTKQEAKDFGIDESDRGFYCRLANSKGNFGPPQPDRWLERKRGGVLVPVNLEEKANAKKTGGRRDDV